VETPSEGRNSDPLLSCAEAAEWLGVPERMVRHLVAERRIDYVKVGRYVRLKVSTLEAFVEAHSVSEES
jgi:excisionase family DNA binding protein